MLLIIFKLPYYGSIMLHALELYYAQNYAGIIRQGLIVEFDSYVQCSLVPKQLAEIILIDERSEHWLGL